MELPLAILTGVLYAVAIYLLLKRSLVKLIIGLSLLGNAANLLILTSGGIRSSNPPLVPEGALVPDTIVADPLPEALILTAIVIGFGVIAFTLVLAHRVHQETEIDSLDSLGASRSKPRDEPHAH